MSYRIALLTKNRTNPAYDGARTGAERVAARMGGTVLHYVPDIADDPAGQSALIGAALAARPDALVIAPTHPEQLNGHLAGVKQAGIPLVYFVSHTPGLEPDVFVTADNYRLARGVGDYLTSHLGGQGAVAIVEGSANSLTSPPRTQGFLDALASRPAMRVAAIRSGHYQRGPAHAAMREILAQGAPPAGVLCANDHMAMGVLQALDETGARAVVAGVNAMPEAIGAIGAGRLLVTAAYDAMQMGCIATEAAIRLLAGQPVPARIELPVALVDAANCAPWRLPFEQRPLPQWDAALELSGHRER